ncbi:TPA: SDR family NAD(P)-dependent oxidoreductase, partial [Escherichia coli]|nr:SDR family NAD(P)-dependent oxidoreductase [Escherichia coli]
MSNFAGKVILVTGGAHGIGKGIAKQFADRGAHTVIVDYNEENGKSTAAELTFGDV